MITWTVYDCFWMGIAWLIALVAGPAVFLVLPAAGGVAHLDRSRSFAPLVRGGLERACVLGASLLASLGSAALLSRTGAPGLVLAGPALGAVPWVAGEVLSGRSRRSPLALAASVLAGGAAAGASAAWLHFEAPVARWGYACAALVCAATVAFASLPYLALRGPTRAR